MNMNLLSKDTNVECRKYREYMSKGPNPRANHRVYKFPNGWGASVLEEDQSKGVELVPVKFNSNGRFSVEWEPYTYLTPEKVEEHLTDIYHNGKNCKKKIWSPDGM